MALFYPKMKKGMRGGVFSALTLLVLASTASALTLTGGPTYTLPGGGSCTTSGVSTQTGGTTVSCTGVNLGAHTNVYYGIRNDTTVNGNTMTGTAPAPSSGEEFTYTSDTATSVTYSSATTVNDAVLGNQAVANTLVLSLTGTGSVVPTGGIPGNNGNGDIERLFKITGGTSFTVNVDITAVSPSFSGAASTAVYDPTETPLSGASDTSRVDLAFYFSDCGDGVTDSPEECDEGAANGTSTSCCTSTCTFRASSEICRPGAGAPCDASEMCTGAAGACPADDAPINSGNVCRAGSGDICDANETCTGVPGEGCPADDAPGNSGLTCRVGSIGGICDQDETCNGVPGDPCPPDDAPGNLNMICRAGSGDACDPNEVCTGVPGQGCPADIVEPPTTQCRAGSGDSCDPDENCTGIPGQACPSDTVQSAGTECRAAVDACDVAETCSGTALDPCPADAFSAAGTSCDIDSDVCTEDECDGSGGCFFAQNLDCSDGSSCTQDSCDPINGCEYSGAPSGSCVGPVRAVLKYKDQTPDKRDKVVFVWKGGPALVTNMGDPLTTTDYELCIYDNNGVQLAMHVPSGLGWKQLGKPANLRGYKFKDKTFANDGVKLVLLKGSSLDKGKAKVVAKKENVPDTATLPFAFPVTAQVYADGGMCWEAQFQTQHTKRNEIGKFIAKIKP